MAGVSLLIVEPRLFGSSYKTFRSLPAGGASQTSVKAPLLLESDDLINGGEVMFLVELSMLKAAGGGATVDPMGGEEMEAISELLGV